MDYSFMRGAVPGAPAGAASRINQTAAPRMGPGSRGFDYSGGGAGPSGYANFFTQPGMGAAAIGSGMGAADNLLRGFGALNSMSSGGFDAQPLPWEADAAQNASMLGGLVNELNGMTVPGRLAASAQQAARAAAGANGLQGSAVANAEANSVNNANNQWDQWRRTMLMQAINQRQGLVDNLNQQEAMRRQAIRNEIARRRQTSQEGGSSIGAGLGGLLGVALAPFTGGLSIPVGSGLGGLVGGFAGGGYNPEMDPELQRAYMRYGSSI